MKLRKVTAASAAVLALALTATACGSRRQGRRGVGASGGGGKITIGIKFDQPGLGLKKPDGTFAGFDVDVATYVAKELGYEPGPDRVQARPRAPTARTRSPAAT